MDCSGERRQTAESIGIAELLAWFVLDGVAVGR